MSVDKLSAADHAAAPEVMRALFNGGLSWLTVLEWAFTHKDQIAQAIKDIAAGKGFQVVIDDLLALIKAGE